MSLPHSLLRFCVGFLTVCYFSGMYALQEARSQAPRFPSSGAIHLIVPQFVAEAVRFKAIDETGYDWPGSDEVYVVFSDLNPTLQDVVTDTFEDVDAGETRDFAREDRCIAPRPTCGHGVSESLHFEVSFWEADRSLFEFCYGDMAGLHYYLHHGLCNGDDLIGRSQVLMSREQLLALLPTIGDSREFTMILGGPCGYSADDVVGCGPPWPNGPEYHLTYRITRLPDVERPLVIAPPREQEK